MSAADGVVYGGLFAASFLAATVLPGSSEAALAGLRAAGRADPWALVAAATAGNVLGSVVNWTCGRFLSRFRDRRWFPVRPAWHDRARGWFERYGRWSLLFAWVPVIGDPLTVIAGALRVPLIPFVVLVTLGKAARYLMVMGAVAVWRAG